MANPSNFAHKPLKIFFSKKSIKLHRVHHGTLLPCNPAWAARSVRDYAFFQNSHFLTTKKNPKLIFSTAPEHTDYKWLFENLKRIFLMLVSWIFLVPFRSAVCTRMCELRTRGGYAPLRRVLMKVCACKQMCCTCAGAGVVVLWCQCGDQWRTDVISDNTRLVVLPLDTNWYNFYIRINFYSCS